MAKHGPPFQFPEPVSSVAREKSPSMLASKLEYFVVVNSARKVF